MATVSAQSRQPTMLVLGISTNIVYIQEQIAYVKGAHFKGKTTKEKNIECTLYRHISFFLP